jgi:hypothetical protein
MSVCDEIVLFLIERRFSFLQNYEPYEIRFGLFLYEICNKFMYRATPFCKSLYEFVPFDKLYCPATSIKVINNMWLLRPSLFNKLHKICVINIKREWHVLLHNFYHLDYITIILNANKDITKIFYRQALIHLEPLIHYMSYPPK